MGSYQERLGLRGWTSCPVRDIGRLQDPGANLLCNGAIPISRRTFDALMEYSTTLPTGTSEGKVWKCEMFLTGEWWLGRFGAEYPAGHEYAGQVPITWHRIMIEGEPARWPRDVRVPPRRIVRL